VDNKKGPIGNCLLVKLQSGKENGGGEGKRRRYVPKFEKKNIYIYRNLFSFMKIPPDQEGLFL
jgi:hypothetical protein